MGSNPPLPTVATYDIPSDTLRVDFDATLNPQPITGSTVTFRVSNMRRRATFVNALGNRVSGSSVVVGADVGVDGVDYGPPPFDIRRADTLLPAAAFTDFPLTVIP